MAGPIRVFYDADCGACQTGITWLRFLDRHGRTLPVPIEASAVAAAGLDLEACREQLHIVTPEGVRAGWNAVTYLARLFPLTWLIGAIGSVPPFRWLGSRAYRWFARRRYLLGSRGGHACRIPS